MWNSHRVPSVLEQLGRRQPANPRAHHDHTRRVSRGLQPILDNPQQLLVVLVVETILREAREPLGTQETHEQEDQEEDWGGKKRREGSSVALALRVIPGGTDWLRGCRHPRRKKRNWGGCEIPGTSGSITEGAKTRQ